MYPDPDMEYTLSELLEYVVRLTNDLGGNVEIDRYVWDGDTIKIWWK
jgi:hypothetical protein